MGLPTAQVRYVEATRRVLVGLCLGTSLTALAAEAPDRQVPASILNMSPPSTLIFDAANGQRLDVDVRDNFQLRFLIPDDPRRDTFAATSGVWQPLQSIALSAGYGVAEQQPGSALLAGCGDQAPCLQAIDHRPSMIETYSLGASWRVSNSLSLKMDYLNRQADAAKAIAAAPWIGPHSGSFGASAAGLNIGNAEALDLSLTCDIDAGQWGDLELGLQVSRVVNQDIEFRGQGGEVPYTSAAFGVGWQRGAFRGDFTSRYLDVVSQPNDAAGWTSFDVNFAWRMPWNARVSVGARNVLNTPAPATSNLSDAEMENFFGRVPYVRYQQDL